MELDLKLILPIVSIFIGTVIAFYKIKNEYDKDLRKFDKELNEKIHKLENEKINNLQLEIERLKGRDENQQQIINQFQTQILDHLPKIYEIINNQINIKKIK
ncbi:MAG: hypothetical protein HC854_07770 [Flavobacterium sp.]|nr:hypothetical protein [Flavobacterium sp.]